MCRKYNLNYITMAKNTFYVVNLVYVDLHDHSVETFVLGCTPCLTTAKNILTKKHDEMAKMGYSPEKFKFFPWEWEYKHQYGIIKATIDSVSCK